MTSVAKSPEVSIESERPPHTRPGLGGFEGMEAMQSRLSAMEGSYFRGEQDLAIVRQVERLVREGKLPASALETLGGDSANGNALAIGGSSSGGTAFQGVETVTRGRPEAEFVYQHTKGAIPKPNLPNMKEWGLGVQVSMGRDRWAVDDVSIFSVEEGKRLASTPRRLPSNFEIKQAEAIRRAAAQTPLVHGYRLYPNMTPARALLWGTVVAFAGTALGAKLAMIWLEIREMDDVSIRLRETLHPFAEGISSIFKPWKGLIQAAGEQGSEIAQKSQIAQLAKTMKEKLQQH